MKIREPTLFDEGMLSHQGRVRTVNEDNYGTFRTLLRTPLEPPAVELLQRRGYLYVVADGMGGHQQGELASALAVKEICRHYYQSANPHLLTSLYQAINQANRTIYLYGREHGATLGTTVVCAIIHAGQLLLAHVGDSRAYRLRQRQLHQLTSDHDWITEQMRQYGLARPIAEQAAQSRGAQHTLLRALGVAPVVAIECQTLEWKPTDVLLLCSDGLHKHVQTDEVCQILAESPAPLAARQLISRANEAGGHDNITVLVVREHKTTRPFFKRLWVWVRNVRWLRYI